ncbi:C40 family peptidase [Streptomyces sp. NBC_01221]|uniref:C40 family peptidase n=1 Tax=unclassified Streptomyces TaxID=2593676 RepID=UPI00224FFFF0|nr:C40 family peptidase [Streptomyces sp. NBC_01221]MCX4786189.1 C40 family peptidase [Streptomyces sp. NBC_01221]WSP54635.1 C40 family peptidase [Streptomyces sp. NBC_01241]
MVSHRRSTQPGLNRGARITVLSAAAATAAATLGAATANADPQDTSRNAKARVDRLYGEAERAIEQYNAAGENAGRLRGEVNRARDRAARGQEHLNRLRTALGSVVSAQYRSGGLDPSLALLLSSDPDTYLDRAATLDRQTERRSDELRELQQTQRGLAQIRAEAARALAELERNRAAATRHKRTVERKLAQAKQVLAALPAADRADFEQVSRSGGYDVFPATADLPAGSARAAAAVAAVRQALGRPYIWGANGPAGFDCSGLMQWAYARAGVSLPRTSQAQRYAGRMVPLSEARPGDLVAYRADAGHIAMYVGNGQVVHAPYPGAPVRYDPVGMMPVSSVTRV